MTSKSPPRRDIHLIYAGLALIAGGWIEYFQGQADKSLLYLGVSGICVGIFHIVINKYNARTPARPIKLWLSNLILAALVCAVGLSNYSIGGTNYKFIFILSLIPVAVAGFYYLKGK